jgi:hypothetical protein
VIGIGSISASPVLLLPAGPSLLQAVVAAVIAAACFVCGEHAHQQLHTQRQLAVPLPMMCLWASLHVLSWELHHA